MISLVQLLNERYLNLLGGDKKKEEYKQVVWDMLQFSYKSIGGIKGRGFNSPEDMVSNIDQWKLAKIPLDKSPESHRFGGVVAVVMYKTTDIGKKAVAVGTDGSKTGKMKVADIMIDDITKDRAAMEVSSNALSFMMKNFGATIKYMLPYEEVHEILIRLGKEVFPVEAGDVELKKWPELKPYLYRRKIGGACIRR